MSNKNCVIFKGTKVGISIYLDENTEYSILKEQLQKKVLDAAKFFEGFKTNIIFKGKPITEEEEIELLTIISENTNMNILFVQSENETESEMPVLMEETLQQHNVTKYYKGNIRSGQVLEFKGSIIIIGDVNPGSIVRAEGNIVVLGALKGVAHAGCNGMSKAFVCALSMSPVQLRIADIITRFPDSYKRKNNKHVEYAYIEDGQIYVVPLD